MKKKALIIGCLLGVISPITISYKTTKSHGSPKVLNDKTTTISYPKEDQDCIAWRFYLTGTLFGMARQTTVNERTQKRDEDPHNAHLYHGAPPATKIEEILPAKTAKKIIDTIIKKEGGVCSREILYETPCLVHSERGILPGVGLGADLHGKFTLNYFSLLLGVPIDEDNLDQLNDFLKDHISKSLDYRGPFYEGFHCYKKTCPVKTYYALNSFGLCMLKKHKQYLKDHDLFDLDQHNFYENSMSLKVDKESLRSFIERSNEIAAEAKVSSSKTKEE